MCARSSRTVAQAATTIVCIAPVLPTLIFESCRRDACMSACVSACVREANYRPRSLSSHRCRCHVCNCDFPSLRFRLLHFSRREKEEDGTRRKGEDNECERERENQDSIWPVIRVRMIALPFVGKKEMRWVDKKRREGYMKMKGEAYDDSITCS